jgi:glycosyltransferase involved in cell wall biosynthesis
VKDKQANRVHRVAMVCSHPIQYLSPWFADLAQDSRLQVTVLYGDEHGMRQGFDPGFGKAVRWDVDLGSGYRFVTLKNRAPRPGVGHFFGILNPELLRVLSPRDFDAVVIQGWNYALYPLALAVARWRRLPVLLRCESVTPRDGCKRELLRRYLGACAATLAVSTGNRRLLVSYGVPPERIFFSPYAVDGHRFALPAPERQAARAAWRQRLNIDDAMPLLLFAGKLLPVKAPELLLQAFFALRRLGVKAHLCFCGDGELRRSLEQAATGVPEVSFVGFLNQTAMPGLYAAADALVLPSHETFGMVVLEAMHAGLPVVVSDGVGCAEDLVLPHPRYSQPAGLCFPAGDLDALTGCLRELCEGSAAATVRAALTAGAAPRLASFSYAKATRGLCDALDAILPISSDAVGKSELS